jgi:hypothetical protein
MRFHDRTPLFATAGIDEFACRASVYMRVGPENTDPSSAHFPKAFVISAENCIPGVVRR